MNLKHLLILATLGLGFWFIIGKLRASSSVQAVQQAPVNYVHTLQADEHKAEKAAQTANETIRKTEEAVKAAEAPQAE